MDNNMNGSLGATTKRKTKFNTGDFWRTPARVTQALSFQHHHQSAVPQASCSRRSLAGTPQAHPAVAAGVSRTHSILRQAPPARVWFCGERSTFRIWERHFAGGGTTSGAWFVWSKDYAKPTELNGIEQRYKARLGPGLQG
jgi:hypothetical protein